MSKNYSGLRLAYAEPRVSAHYEFVGRIEKYSNMGAIRAPQAAIPDEDLAYRLD